MKKTVQNLFKKEWFLICLVVVAVMGCIFQLLRRGFYEPQDLHHLADIYEMTRAFLSGQFPPRWGPDFLYNFGYPLFNFYYVGPFYLGSLFYLLSGSLRFSYEAVFEFGVILGAVSFYLFLRNHFSKIASFCGAILFSYTPYRAVQIYVRGAMGEFLTVSLMPIFLYFNDRLIKDGRKRWFVFSVLVASFIILSHNYFWVLIFGFCGIYYLFVSVFSKKFEIIKNFLLQIFLSIGITTYWWLPAFTEQKLLQVQTPFPLIDHFPFIKQLLIPSWGYGASLWGPLDGMSFQLGIVNIFAVLLSLVVFAVVKNRRKRKIFLWSVISFSLCLFFMNVRSFFIWRLVPFYNLFQFPWRLLAFAGFFSSVLAAWAIENILSNRKLLAKIVASVIVLSSVILTINYFKPSKIFYKSDTDYLKRMFADQVTSGDGVSNDYKNYSEDYLLLPKWVSEKPSSLPENKFESTRGDEILVKSVAQKSAVSWVAEVEVKNRGFLNFYSLYFPGWTALVDGKMVDITYGDMGQIVINLNPGDSIVEVFWVETPLRKVADMTSLFFVLILTGMFFWKRDFNETTAKKNKK